MKPSTSSIISSQSSTKPFFLEDKTILQGEQSVTFDGVVVNDVQGI